MPVFSLTNSSMLCHFFNFIIELTFIVGYRIQKLNGGGPGVQKIDIYVKK